jgi:hypothetical protein
VAPTECEENRRLPQVFPGNVLIPGDQIDADLAALQDADEARIGRSTGGPQAEGDRCPEDGAGPSADRPTRARVL